MSPTFGEDNIRPVLFNDANGNLFIKIEIGRDSKFKKVPPITSQEQYVKWLNDTVPQLIDDVRRMAEARNKRFNRRVRNVRNSKEHRRNTEGSHLKSVK